MKKCLYCGHRHDSGVPCPPELLHSLECSTGRQIVIELRGTVANWSVVNLNGPSGVYWLSVGKRFENRWPLTDVRIGYREVQLTFGRWSEDD